MNAKSLLPAMMYAQVTIEIIDTRTGQPLEQSTDLAHPYYWAPFILIGNGL